MVDDFFLDRLKRKYANKDVKNFNYFDFLYSQGSPFDALFYSHLFWPEFMEFNDMVFLRGVVEDACDFAQIEEVFKSFSGDRCRVERSFNLIEFSILFGPRISETNEREDRELAKKIVDFWRIKIHLDFPKKKFIVRELSLEESGGETAIVFYTDRAG